MSLFGRISQFVRPVRISRVRLSLGQSVLMPSFSILSRQISLIIESQFETINSISKCHAQNRAAKRRSRRRRTKECWSFTPPPTTSSTRRRRKRTAPPGAIELPPRTRRPRDIRAWITTTVGLVRPKEKGSATNFRANSSRKGGSTREAR